jgi:hypothetical protein
MCPRASYYQYHGRKLLQHVRRGGEQGPAEVDDSAQLPVQDGLEQEVAHHEKGTQSEGQVEDIADVESHVYWLHIFFRSYFIFFPLLSSPLRSFSWKEKRRRYLDRE